MIDSGFSSHDLNKIEQAVMNVCWQNIQHCKGCYENRTQIMNIVLVAHNLGKPNHEIMKSDSHINASKNFSKSRGTNHKVFVIFVVFSKCISQTSQTSRGTTSAFMALSDAARVGDTFCRNFSGIWWNKTKRDKNAAGESKWGPRLFVVCSVLEKWLC